MFGDYYMANYATVRPNVTLCRFRTLHPTDPRAADNWALMTRADISDVIHLFVDEAGFSDEQFFIEGVSGECRVGPDDYDDVTVTPNLSPAAYYGTDVF